jgi:MEMO1 family protein
MESPRMRYVEALPVRQGDEVFVLLRDPEDLCGEEMVVSASAYLLLTLLDGTRDAGDVQQELLRQTGQVIPRESIETFIKTLDGAYLLDNGRSRERREAIRREFAELASRPAAHAGSSYSADPRHLRDFLDGFLREASAAEPVPPPDRPFPRGLIVPHIDLRCGGRSMARGFRTLMHPPAPRPCRYVILGVAHAPTPHLYTLTAKAFETPLGMARIDRDAVERLGALYGDSLFEGELAHKREHSVEFAAVFLRHLHSSEEDFSIVPLLCGSLHEEFLNGHSRSPVERDDVGRFCDALRTLLEEPGPPTCIVASVDLSHVGPKFGDERGVDPFRAQAIRSADLAMLELVRRRDAEGFFDHFRADANARNVDAVTAVYTLLQALGPGSAELLDYDQHLDLATESVVSFAAMALY